MNSMKAERKSSAKSAKYIRPGKLLRGAVAGAAAAAMLGFSAFAATGSSGVVSVNTSLNVRSAASTSASVLGRLYNGSKVTILGSSGGWYKISYGSGTAWVSGGYVLTGTAARQHTVVAAAEGVLGSPYVYGGATTAGFDCSGLALYAYAKTGVTLPHSAAQQAKLGWAVSRSSLQPGDLIFFDTEGSGTVTHEGVYIGNNTFIQAESGKVQKVVETSLSNSYWSGVYVTARRYIG